MLFFKKYGLEVTSVISTSIPLARMLLDVSHPFVEEPEKYSLFRVKRKGEKEVIGEEAVSLLHYVNACELFACTCELIIGEMS